MSSRRRPIDAASSLITANNFLITAALLTRPAGSGQEIIARHYNRVLDANAAKKYAAQFPAIKLVAIEEVFGGSDNVTKTHFADGGILDQALTKAPAR